MIFISVLLISVVIASSWMYWKSKNKKLLEIASKLPGPKTVPLFGNALMFMCHYDEFITVIKDMMSEYGDWIRFWLGPDLNIVVSDPDDLRILLTSSKTSYKGVQYKYMADVLGGGILSGSGPVWRRHRKIANPNYGKRAVESYSETFNKEVGILLDSLKGLPRGKVFDLYKHIVKTTSYTVCQTLMGLTRDETLSIPHLQEVIDTSPRLYDVVFDRMTKWWYQIDPIFWMTNSYQVQKHFIEMMDDFCKVIIRYRTNTLKNMENNKLMLLNSEEDSLANTQLSVIDRFILSNELDSQEMIDETFTIFTSSQEATAKITSFLLLMMAYHQENQERLYQEIVSVIGEKDRPVTDDHFKQMPYLEMAFKEVLRMFPIGALLQRSVIEDVTISKGTIPKGCSLVIPIYHLQRDRRHWNNPEAFDPDRFSPENIKTRHPYSYIPFSLGPMDCLGRHFGTKLVKTVAVQVLREFKVTAPDTYDDMKIAIAVSVTSLKGFNMMLTPRRKNQ